MNGNRYVAMAAWCVAVALLAALAAGLGIFARGDATYATVTSVRGVTYEMATSGVYAYNAQRVVAEGIGWDVFTLLLAVPALLLASWFVARGSFRGRLVALGLLGYFFYQYLEYAMTWAFGPLFLLFVALFAASLAGLVWLGTSIARDGIQDRFSGRFPARAFSGLSTVMALLLTMMWVQRIGLALQGDLASAGLRGETTLVVQALDLGLVVPSALFISVLAWRRTDVGLVLAAIYAVASIAIGAAIIGMLLSASAIAGAFEIVPLAIFGAYVLAMGLLAVRIYRSATAEEAVIEGSVLIPMHGTAG